MTRADARLVSTSALVFAGDQLTKIVFGVGAEVVRNEATTLGIVQGSRLALVLVMATMLAVIGRRAVVLARATVVPAVAVGLAIGGAGSNLFDRVEFGAVRDLITIGPIIVNLADLAVVVGVTSCALPLARRRRGDRASAARTLRRGSIPDWLGWP